MQIHERDDTILTYDADAFGFWRPDAAFRLMQEISGEHSAMLGFSRADLMSLNGSVWMLARARLEMARYPKWHDVVHAKTWYANPGRTTYARYVTIADTNGASIGVFATSWILVDTRERHILLPARAGLQFPPAAEIAPPLPEPGKVRLLKTGEKQTICRAPAYSDLDVNGHMNNASYVGWVMDLFPMEWHEGHKLRSLSMGYSAEARPGRQVEMSLYRDGCRFEVLGIDATDGHVVFEAVGEFSADAMGII